MAVGFSLSAAPLYPTGAVIGAYQRRYFSGAPPVQGQTPGGSPVATTATVNTLGVAEFSGLLAETHYYAGAEVNGVWKWTAFRTNPEPGGGGGGLGPGSVSTEDIQDGAVTTPKIKDSAVTNQKLAAEAVNSAKIEVGSVNKDRLSLEVQTKLNEKAGIIGEGTIETSQLKDGSVTEPKLAGEAVSNAKLKAKAVTTAKVENLAITEPLIAVEAVSTAKIKAEAVGTTQLANLSVTTAKVAAGAISKEKLSSGVQTELAEKGGGGVSIVSEFVDINNFFNLKGEKRGISAVEANELIGGKKRDAAPIIQEAIEKAMATAPGALAYKGGPKGSVSASEPGKYWLESTRLSTAPSAAYPKLRAPYSAATFNACLHLYKGVAIESPMGNASHLNLEVGPTVWEKCITERESNPNYACVAIGVEPTSTIEKLVLGHFTLGCSANLEPWTFSKNPPPLPDGVYAGASGFYEGLNIQGGFRYGIIQGANHYQMKSIQMGGWARVANTNWASYGGVTGNAEFFSCNFSGGFCSFYAESEVSTSSVRIYGGWTGFGNKGPIFYKPTTVAASFLNGIHIYGMQFEAGRGPLFYNEDGKGIINRVFVTDLQAISSDPVMSGAGPTDITIGYRPEVPIFGAGTDAYIKAGTIKTLQVVQGAIIGEVGWGKEAAAIIATEEASNIDLGDASEAINKCNYRGIPLIRTPSLTNMKGTYFENSGVVRSWAMGYTNTAVKEGEILRRAASAEPKASHLAVERFNKAGAVMSGQALMSAAAEQFVPIARRDVTRPATAVVPVAQLGHGEGQPGKVPPPARAGKLKLLSALENGAATGEGHAPPVVIYGGSPFKGALFLSSLADLPSEGTLSTGPGTIFNYRQSIAKGTETTLKAVLTSKSVELTGVKVSGISAITGISPGMKITGTGIPLNTMIENVDGEGFKLTLSNAATVSGEQTLKVVAPLDILEGVLIGSSTRSTEVIKLASMTGAGTIKVVSTAGMAAAGTVQVQGTPWTKATKYNITYTSKTATELKGCNVGSAVAELPAQTIIVPVPSEGKINNRQRIYRVAEYEAASAATTTFENAEINLTSTPVAIKVANGLALSAEGRALIETQTTLPADIEFSKTAKTLKVVSTASFPTTPPKKEGEKLGKLEIGNDAHADVLAVLNATEFEVEGIKAGAARLKRLKGEVVKLPPVEIVYTGHSATELTGVEAITEGIGPANHKVKSGATVTQLTSSVGGGIFEVESVRYGYRGRASAKGKTYLYGVSTPGGGGSVASGKEIEDLTVLTVEGAGFPAGPASVVIFSKSPPTETTFTYTAFLQVNGESAGEEGGEPEEGVEPEVPEEGEPGAAVAQGYFAGVANAEGNKLAGGNYTGGTQLNATAKAASTPTSITVLSTAGFPTIGVLKLATQELKYTGLTNTTFTGITGWTGSTEYAAGKAVTLYPTKQIAADTAVAAAFRSGREGEGDKGVVIASTEGERVGVSTEADQGGTVSVEF